MGISMKTTSGKILASVALVGTAAAVAGLGTYGAFTSTTQADQAVTAGSVAIDLGKGAPNTLETAITDMLPGDSVAKFVTLTNSGTSALNNVTLTTSTANPSALTTNQTNGLKLTIESCPAAWTPGATAGTYDCKGGATTVVPVQPMIPTGTASTALGGVPSSLTAGGIDHLKITTSFPTAALQTEFPGNPTSTIKFSFTGTQRAAVTQ
ncbi:TasA family protein [Arthrobacter sp. ZGTC412]|uniref:TasA family protein n=1 Tax=Arthrobacter sp. ZGTC412 TaxID=2058900 RepID=UPI000CE30B6B|nr:TasA family protein [Arthrobacter sp. ZGTC412]